jgi:hypothetical protein
MWNRYFKEHTTIYLDIQRIARDLQVRVNRMPNPDAGQLKALSQWFGLAVEAVNKIRTEAKTHMANPKEYEDQIRASATTAKNHALIIQKLDRVSAGVENIRDTRRVEQAVIRLAGLVEDISVQAQKQCAAIQDMTDQASRGFAAVGRRLDGRGGRNQRQHEVVLAKLSDESEALRHMAEGQTAAVAKVEGHVISHTEEARRQHEALDGFVRDVLRGVSSCVSQAEQQGTALRELKDGVRDAVAGRGGADQSCLMAFEQQLDELLQGATTNARQQTEVERRLVGARHPCQK